MVRNSRWLILVVVAVLVTACATGMRSKANALESTLLAYQNAMRWGQTSGMQPFFDPEAPAIQNLRAIELERWEQFEVKGYRKQSDTVVDKEGFARQTIEIELVNRHTQTPKQAIDRQVWRFESKSGRWLLSSGLPKILD